MSLRWQLWYLASPSQLVLGAALAGGVLLALSGARGRRMRLAQVGRGLAIAGGLGLIACGLLPTGHYLAHLLEARFPRPLLPTEVAGIVLLGGAERPEASDRWGEPQVNAAGGRYVTALRLARRYPAARLVHTGTSRPRPGSGPMGTQSGVAGELLASLADEPSRIVLEPEALDTCQHPGKVRRLVRPQPGETWVLVTSAIHMPRAVACFRSAGWTDIVPYPADRTVVPGGWDVTSLRLADNLALFDTALHEWLGLAYYRYTGRIAEIFPAP